MGNEKVKASDMGIISKEEMDQVYKVLMENKGKLSNRIDPDDPNIFHTHLEQFFPKNKRLKYRWVIEPSPEQDKDIWIGYANVEAKIDIFSGVFIAHKSFATMNEALNWMKEIEKCL